MIHSYATIKPIYNNTFFSLNLHNISIDESHYKTLCGTPDNQSWGGVILLPLRNLGVFVFSPMPHNQRENENENAYSGGNMRVNTLGAMIAA